MSPVEFKKLDVNGLISLSESALKYVMDSYESRPVSSDVVAFGQTNDETPASEPNSKEEMRKAIALQKSGKGASLAESEDKDEDKEKKNLSEEGGEGDEKKAPKSYAMDDESFQKCMGDLSDMHTKMSGMVDHFKKMSEAVDKMAAGEEEDEKKEMAAEEAPEEEGDKK
jgi:hypothetical protein